MTKFLNAKRYGMTNAVHFSVDEAFYARLLAAGFTHEGLVALVAEFKASLAEEDKYLQLSRKSDLSAEISAADGERDKCYITLKQVVAAWVAQQLDPQLTASEALQKVVDTYKINVRSQLDEETGKMTNFITDVEALAAHLETLGLTETVAKMKAANEKVKSLLASRADERAQQVAGALKEARLKCDEIYTEITTLIEGLSVAAEDTSAYETFISQWNEEIERVKQQTKRKASSTKKKE